MKLPSAPVRTSIAFLLILAMAPIVALDVTAQLATSGPNPPPNAGPKRGPVTGLDALTRTIAGVPAYRWRHGCGPTAVGMVVGYHDGNGVPDLIPGSAATQTNDVNQAIASQGSGTRGVGVQKHYEDYSLPMDSSGAIQKDSSETYPVNCHLNDCIGDFMHTSWSANGLRYGWSYSNKIAPSFTSYVTLKCPNHTATVQQYSMGSSLTWALLKSEIDADHPMVFLVDTNQDGQTDHFVTVVGYNETSTSNQYGCLDTWNPVSTIRWEEFRTMSTSYNWGVWGGWTFRIAPPSPTPAPQVGGIPRRSSVDSAGKQGNGASLYPSISADSRFVAFESDATDLVAGDTNGFRDIFVHDHLTGKTARVSVDSSGMQGDQNSLNACVSADGRYVAFESTASNLVAGDTNGFGDIFVHDRVTGKTTRVSVDSVGLQGNQNSQCPSLSADGNQVAFDSNANNLVSGDTNGVWDVFVHDRVTGKTTRVSVDSAGVQGNKISRYPSLSADGRYVAFHSSADNLVAGDTNNVWDVFVHDRITGTTTRVSVDSAGVQGNNNSANACVSADGRCVAFQSVASNLVAGDTNNVWDVFVHDRMTGKTTRVSVDSAGMQGYKESTWPSISADGRDVAFESEATTLVAEDTNNMMDVFIHDRVTGKTARVSLDAAGRQGNRVSTGAALSADGRFVAFFSPANNLVPDDSNGVLDIFVHDGIPSPTLIPTGRPRVGTSVTLDLRSPDDVGRAYVLGSSLRYWPGIRVDTRDIPLDLDLLLGMSWGWPAVFQNYMGILDAQGRTLAYIHIPGAPALAGLKFYTAFVTIDPAAPSGIRGISNAVELTVVQ
jgi:hypothetical protein